MKNILDINAHLKYVEFLLHTFDTGSEDLTLKEMRLEFQKKFSTLHPLLNQNFGIYRLLPLMLMREINKKQGLLLNDDIEKIKEIRDSIAHYDFLIDENGYVFKSGKKQISFSYSEFNEFLYRIENEFYNKNLN